MFRSGVVLTSVILSIIEACGCPANWLYLPDNNRCYFSSIRLGSTMDTYFGARRRCQEDGGDLATMANEYEYRLIRNDLHDSTSNVLFWVGACWSSSDSLRYIDGSDVPAVVSSGYISGIPAFGAAMSSVGGQLIDGNPHIEKYYVCQKEHCSRSVQTAWCNEPQSSTSLTNPSTDTVSSTAMLDQSTSSTVDDRPGKTSNTTELSPDSLDVTGWSVSTRTTLPDSSHEDNNKESVYIYIGIGVGVGLVLLISCVLVACIIIRKRRNKKANGDYPQENNMSMVTKGTDQSLTNSMLTGHTNPSDKLMYEESGYAEVDGHPNEAIPGKPVPAEDVVYDTATAVDIGVARKHDTNDMAMYATPVRVRGNTEQEKDDDSSDEENTQIVENTIYGE